MSTVDMEVAHVTEIARLANIALAEVGVPELVEPHGRWHGEVSDFCHAFKASLLAVMAVRGPDYLIHCQPCGLASASKSCPKYPVRDVLVGRSCGVS